jgi:hypothetical protein
MTTASKSHRRWFQFRLRTLAPKGHRFAQPRATPWEDGEQEDWLFSA